MLHRTSGIRLSVAFAGALGAVTLLSWGCSTEAVGIDACRRIESARCDAAPTCEGTDQAFGITTEAQIRNCKAFYIDHCLLGIENTEAEPGEEDVVPCEEAIVALGACQTNGVATMAECEGVTMVEGQEALTPCEALRNPETLSACAFVAAVEEE